MTHGYLPETLEQQAINARRCAEEDPHFDALRAANTEATAVQQLIDRHSQLLPEGYSIYPRPGEGGKRGWYYVRGDTDGNAVGRYPLTEDEASAEAWVESGKEPPPPSAELTDRLRAAEACRRQAGQALDAIRQKYATGGGIVA